MICRSNVWTTCIARAMAMKACTQARYHARTWRLRLGGWSRAIPTLLSRPGRPLCVIG
jgi:hypothetical protein